MAAEEVPAREREGQSERCGVNVAGLRQTDLGYALIKQMTDFFRLFSLSFDSPLRCTPLSKSHRLFYYSPLRFTPLSKSHRLFFIFGTLQMYLLDMGVYYINSPPAAEIQKSWRK